MQPGSVAAERDQITEREIGVVPHGGHLSPPATAGGTDLTHAARVIDPAATASGADCVPLSPSCTFSQLAPLSSV